MSLYDVDSLSSVPSSSNAVLSEVISLSNLSGLIAKEQCMKHWRSSWFYLLCSQENEMLLLQFIITGGMLKKSANGLMELSRQNHRFCITISIDNVTYTRRADGTMALSRCALSAPGRATGTFPRERQGPEHRWSRYGR